MQYANGLTFDVPYSRMYSAGMTIGNRLDQAMQMANIPSQSALARASGVPQPTINRILKGAGKNGPETETVKKLAAACNVSFEWLNEAIGDPVRSKKHAEPSKEFKVVDTSVTADEIFDLLESFRLASHGDRAMIIKSAKLAAKRVAGKRDGAAGN
jgi:transcriptional regulator with XRE-family HTH domain